MSYPNQDLTLHNFWHENTSSPSCEYCAERDDYRRMKYETQLRMVWLNMLERYPKYYSVDDYFQACKKTGIAIL